MGKRLIIKGADFSENGIHVASWVKVLTANVGTVAFAANGLMNKSVLFDTADTSALAVATHLKIVFKNWPNDVQQKQNYKVISNLGSYENIQDATVIPPDTLSEVKAATISGIITRLNNSEIASCVVQSSTTSQVSGAFTSEEQTKLTNAGTTIEVEFYKYEE